MLLCMPAFFAVSCATVSESGPTYSQASGSSASVAGASFGGQFMPVGSNSAKFALYAVGRTGVHDKMTVHGLSYRWSSGVTDTVPEAYLGKLLTFRNTMAEGNVVQATLHSPGELRYDTNKEPSVTVNADVSIKTRHGVERKTVALRFDRSAGSGAVLKNGNTENAVLEMRRYGIPASDIDIGANRVGWKP